jgi:hypothetical protein
MTVDLAQVVRLQMAEIDRLRAENQRLVGWIMGEEPDALTALQRVYSDPQTTVPNVIKSAAAAIGWERQKPASVSVVIDFKERVRNARLRQLELDRVRWAAEAIEHQPEEPEPAA